MKLIIIISALSLLTSCKALYLAFPQHSNTLMQLEQIKASIDPESLQKAGKQAKMVFKQANLVQKEQSLKKLEEKELE